MLALGTMGSTLLFQTCLSITTAVSDFPLLFKLQMIRRASVLVLVSILVAYASLGVTGALASILIGETLLSAGFLVHLLRRDDFRMTAPRISDIATLFDYGIRYYLGKLGNFMNFKLGALMLAFLAARSELGLYGQALALAVQFMTLSEALFTIMLPRSSGERDRSADRVATASRFVVGIGIVGVVLAVVLARPVIVLALSSDFSGSITPFRILVLGFFLRSIGKTLEPYLIGADHPGCISMAVASGLAVNAAMLMALFGTYGIIGAAWALVANYLVSTTMLAVFFTRYSGRPLSEIWKWKARDFELMHGALQSAQESLRRRTPSS